jgi:sialate O-acetylesterase
MVSQPSFGPGMMGKSTDLYLEEGAQKIPLATNWKLIPSFATKHEYAHLMNNVATSIFNAMIVPLIPFAIRGSLWYQGETNAGRAYQYRRSFPLMINNWRNVWGEPGKPDNFSFYWVQLSSFGRVASSNKGSGWAELREAQNMTLSLPKTGMAVTTDIGNANDIHPTNKQDVAHRLAVNALKFDYGQNIAHSSPLYDQFRSEGSKAIVSFKFAEGGLTVKDKYGYVKGFEIAGDDKVFYYAKAEIRDNTVIVSHPKVTKPASVRYAWTDAPEDANLYNAAGFPASAFRTDDWQGVTANNKFE